MLRKTATRTFGGVGAIPASGGSTGRLSTMHLDVQPSPVLHEGWDYRQGIQAGYWIPANWKFCDLQMSTYPRATVVLDGAFY